MKTPLVIVLVIVAGMLGFLTIYSQQSGGVAQTQGAPVVNEGSAAAPAAGAAMVLRHRQRHLKRHLRAGGK